MNKFKAGDLLKSPHGVVLILQDYTHSEYYKAKILSGYTGRKTGSIVDDFAGSAWVWRKINNFNDYTKLLWK